MNSGQLHSSGQNHHEQTYKQSLIIEETTHQNRNPGDVCKFRYYCYYMWSKNIVMSLKYDLLFFHNKGLQILHRACKLGHLIVCASIKTQKLTCKELRWNVSTK